MLDYESHWRAIYGEMRTALDAAGLTAVDIFHVFTGDDSPLTKSAEPPLVVYRQDVERNTGVTGSGSLKVLRSNWPMTSYAEDLADALQAASVIISALTDGSFTTSDGYTTTNVSPLGVMSLYEPDANLYAVHFRLEWERSK